MDKFVIANLCKTISFEKFGQEVVIPVDSVIQVYESEGYAVWHGVHFEVFKDEYILTI